MSGKLVVLSSDHDEFEKLASLAPEGVELTWVDSNQPIEAQAAQLKEAVAILLSQVPFPMDLARACPNLKLLQVFSAGTDRLDKQALGELGIKVANNGGGNAIGVAEHAVGLMITMYRRFQLQYAAVRARQWSQGLRASWRAEVHELTGKTVGIVGLGRIGREVAKRLRGWDCDLIYYDVIDHPAELEEELQIRKVSSDELLKSADVVTLHVPLNRHTRGMISDRELDLMKPTAVLINTCRGPVVDEAALTRALREGKIASAGLDVLEEEPTPADNPLLDMENVVVTPHMAGSVYEAFEKSRAFGIRNAARVVAGEEPKSVVLPD